MEFSGNLEGLVADLSWTLSFGDWVGEQSDATLARLRSLNEALPGLGRRVLGLVAGAADRIRLQGEQTSRNIELTRILKLDDKLATFTVLIQLNLGTDITRVYMLLDVLVNVTMELLLVAMMSDEELEELRAHRLEYPDDDCEGHAGFLVGVLGQDGVENLRRMARERAARSSQN